MRIRALVSLASITVCFQVLGTVNLHSHDLPMLEVKLPDAVPEAFEMVLNYVYTDRIDPFRCKKDQNPNKIVLIMMDVYRLAVQVGVCVCVYVCVCVI